MRLACSEQLMRLRQATTPHSRSTEPPGTGRQHDDPPRPQQIEIRLRRSVLIHVVVHRRATITCKSPRAPPSSADCPRTVRKLGDRVRTRRRDQEQLRVTHELEMTQRSCRAPGRERPRGSRSNSSLSTGAPVTPRTTQPMNRCDAASGSPAPNARTRRRRTKCSALYDAIPR